MELVKAHIRPRVIGASRSLQCIQAMIRVRRVCKAWQLWVDDNEDWIEGVQMHFQESIEIQKPWHFSPTKLSTALRCLKGRTKSRLASGML
jgi:hypothetical protein